MYILVFTNSQIKLWFLRVWSTLHATRKTSELRKKWGKLILKKMCLHGQASFRSYLLNTRTGVTKLATFAEILLPNFFSTRHGDQNGRSLERCSCSHCYLAVCHILLQRLHPIFLVSPSQGVALLKHMFGLCLELSHTSFYKSVLWVFLNCLFLPVNLRDRWWFPWY